MRVLLLDAHSRVLRGESAFAPWCGQWSTKFSGGVLQRRCEDLCIHQLVKIADVFPVSPSKYLFLLH